MKNKLQKVIAQLLVVAMCISLLSTFTLAAPADDVQSGVFTYAPHTYAGGDLMDTYYYSDKVFDGSAVEYNEHLATMSMILAASSISSQDADADYPVKSRNLSYLLNEWAFTGFDVNDYYTQRPGEQTMGVGAAYKVIGEGEDAYTVLAIVPRSAGYQKEWAGNFTVGKEGLHQGFKTGRDIILEFASDYVAENKANFQGEVKIWTVGYSRGAGVANLVAAYLNDNPNALGVLVTKENIFAYNFGTPSTVQYANETEKAALEANYKNIFNRYSDYDIVTYAPFKNWNFTYYGSTELFDVDNAEKKAEMLQFLDKTNRVIYDLYTIEGSTADPDNFMPLMLKVGDDLSVTAVPADESYGIPTDQAAFLNSRIDFLTDYLVKDRATYVDGGYQNALQRLTSLYFGLSAEQSEQFFAGASQDLKPLAAAYYCYFLADFYLDTPEGLETLAALNGSLDAVEESIAALAEDETVNTSEWYLFAKAFIDSEDYENMKSLLQGLPNSTTKEQDIVLIQEGFKTLAVGLTSKVLVSGIMAIDMDDEEKDALAAEMAKNEVAAPLTAFFVYLLLGTEDETVDAFNPSNKNVAIAVTFLANAGRYMRVHNNEIILSWLRTEDSYYDSEDWYLHDNIAICPRDDTCPASPYTDVEMDAWYHDSVHYAVKNGLMVGMGDESFAPKGTTTRAQIVTILWRLENEPEADYTLTFKDVEADKWYTDAIRWAASEEIVYGYDAYTFGTNLPVTREQLATLLYRYAEYKGHDVSDAEDTNILDYKDVDSVRDYAVTAMQWCCGTGIIEGIERDDNMYLDPQGNATRAHMATMFMRLCEKVLK